MHAPRTAFEKLLFGHLLRLADRSPLNASPSPEVGCVYWFPNTFWHLPDVASASEHLGVIITIDHVAATLLLCTHREPVGADPTYPIIGEPFDDIKTHIYVRAPKRVATLPIGGRYFGKLSAVQLKELFLQCALHK